MMIVWLLIYLFESAFRNYMIDFFFFSCMSVPKLIEPLLPKIWNLCMIDFAVGGENFSFCHDENESLWWNLIFILLFFYDDKHPFKYEWLLWANMFLCLEANQMPLSWPFLLVLSYFYVCYDPFFMVAHFRWKICCVCKKHEYEAHWKWQIYICRETNVAFGECSRWYGSARNSQKGSAIPVHCFMNDMWILSGFSPLCLLILVKEIQIQEIFMDRQVETECNMNHHLPQLALKNPPCLCGILTCN